MDSDQENTLQELLAQHDQKLYAFCLYLLQGDQDKAYELTASAFAEVSRNAVLPHKAISLLVQAIIKKSHGIDGANFPDDDQLKNLKPNEKKMLGFIRQIILSLPFKARAAVLMRDQLNLGYAQMAEIFHISENEIRRRTLQARQAIRTQLEEVLRDAR